MGKNKKIRGAKITEYNGISFKSQLEVTVYKTLSQAGFFPRYEELKFIIVEGIKPSVPFYTRNNKTREMVLDNKKMIDVTYTPDFTFRYKGILFIIEAKGFCNDVYPLKRKLFRKYLETLGIPCVYFEIYTKKQLLEAIEIIKSYGSTTT